MTAPELPTMLKDIASALEEKARFPKELWDSTPAEALLKLVAKANVIGQLSQQVVKNCHRGMAYKSGRCSAEV